MNWKHTLRALLLAGVCSAIVAGWLAFGGGTDARSAPPAPLVVPGPAGAPAPVSAPLGAPEERQSDRDGVQKAIDGLSAAFRAGDAKAVAGSWTPEGEYIGDDGATFRGRTALEKGYADAFAKGKGSTLEVEVESMRFPSKDTAVVEGHFKLRTAKGERVVSKCSLLYAREDGKWLIAIAREWPGDGLSLRDLEWLIGTWEAKRDGTTVTTKYEWTANKSFIRCTFSIAQEGQTLTGTQMIGKMPSTGGLHQWTFEDSGGIGDADITRDGKKWVIASRASTADGRVVTATNLLTPIDADTFTFQSVERTMDDESLPDLAPVKVTRVKAKP
jgi:uncharacterized protein (TIGR02246 family)